MSDEPLDDLDEYPEGHSPYCWSDCDHPCHDAYDASRYEFTAADMRWLSPTERYGA